MATPLRDEVWRWPGSEPMAVTTDTVSTTVRRRLGLQEGTVRLEATLESFVSREMPTSCGLAGWQEELCRMALSS